MATRPIYIPIKQGDPLVCEHRLEFAWHSGFSVSQKQKSIMALHDAAIDSGLCKHPLEISTKSPDEIGVSLSAFNLRFTTQKKKEVFTVETAYQASKVFVRGGPYKDLLSGTSLEAKRDSRIRNSGKIVRFEFFKQTWDTEPKTAFYNWVYINALHKNQCAVEQLDAYDAFTDIEFNPNKSINCQANAVALYKSLEARGLIKDALASPENYLEIAKCSSEYGDTRGEKRQLALVE